MNRITKHITTAISLEIVLGFLMFLFFHNLLLGVYENAFDVIIWLWFPILIGIISMYAIGWYLGKQLPENYSYKIYHGIIILFAILIIAVLVGSFIFALMPNNDMDSIADVFLVLLVFLIFGGLPTLLVGIWLGNKLSKKLNSHKK
jgi:hypothetical protein